VVVNTGEYPMWIEDVESPDREPVSFSMSLQGEPEASVMAFTVPVGKRLVITRIALDGFKPPLRRVHFSLLLSVGGQQVAYPVLYQRPITTAGGTAISGLQKVRLYAESGTQVGGHMWKAPFDSAYNTYASMHVVGYLVTK
jgi:hypothetical protein